jgi:hypothetical protein
MPEPPTCSSRSSEGGIRWLHVGDAEAAGLRLHGAGPSFTAWAVPGVKVP